MRRAGRLDHGVAGGVQPPGATYPGMVYDTATKKIIQFGGMTGGGIAQNQTMGLRCSDAHLEAESARHGTAASLQRADRAAARAGLQPAHRTGHLHQTSNSGAPADWQYDPVADTWRRFVLGRRDDRSLHTYDRANRLIAFSRNPTRAWSICGTGPSPGRGEARSGELIRQNRLAASCMNRLGRPAP